SAIDIFAAGNDHVLLAIDQKQKPALVHEPDVSRSIPTALQRFDGRRSIVPIAVQNRCGAHDDFPRLTRRANTALVVHDAKIDFLVDMATEASRRISSAEPSGFTSMRG